MKNIHKEKFLIKSVNTKHAPYHNGLVVKTRKKASVHFSFCYIFIYSSLIIFFINLILKEILFFTKKKSKVSTVIFFQNSKIKFRL